MQCSDSRIFRMSNRGTGISLILCLVLSAPAISRASEAVVLDDQLTTLVLGDRIDILEDPSLRLSILDVSSGPQANDFQKSESMKPNLGFTKSAYWVRFALQNNRNVVREVLLELDNAILDEITLYRTTPTGEFSSLTLGDHLPFENREIPNRNPIFVLQVPPEGTSTYYARLFTAGSMSIPLLLHEPHVFFGSDHNTQIAFGLYFGIVLVMGLYNLFLFFAVRDRAYIYYVLFIAGISLFNATISGISYEYVLQFIPFPSLVHKALLFFVVLIGAPGCLFTISFLRTRETAPLLHKFLVGFTISFGVLFFAIAFGPYGPVSKFCALITVTWGFVLTGTGVYVLKKGYRPARFYLLAWVALLTGCVLQASRLFGVLPNMFLTMYGMELGSAIEVVLLSLALADRISIMKQEKEQAQREAIESFKEADRIKNEFLANTSHELRTPLNGIIGIAESLMDGIAGALNKTAKDNLAMVVNAGQRLSSLVNDILDFSKIRHHSLELQLKPVALKQIVDVELALLSPLVGSKEIVLKNEIPEELTAVNADENRLIQIFQNVVGNAIKFTEAGNVTVCAEQQNGMVAATIADTGIGIPPDKIDSIFEAFEQGDGGTARQFGGTGIGLSITKQLVELHGGTIAAQSQVAEGTTITITLPATDQAAQPTELTSQLDYVARPVDVGQEENEADELGDVVPIAAGRGLRVLVVDDEPLNIKVLTNQLTLQGHTVSESRDGEEALKTIERDGKPDLMLLDVMMPKVTGLEVCKKLREKYSPTELPIILLTAKNQLADLLNGFSVGANDYLTKPFSSREVLARIKVHNQIADFAVALAQANDELRVQIIKRSDQLFSTLAMIARGTTQIESLEDGKIIGERYQIESFIGEGGMGSVYQAKVLATGERAAFKIAKSGDALALAELAQEARMAVEVLHENIVRVIDVDVANEGFLYVVMEYLEGASLAETKARWRDLAWGVKVLQQTAAGLSELHKRKLVHRDLKPANLFITKTNGGRDFTVKIVDFGISSWEVAQNLEERSQHPESALDAAGASPGATPSAEPASQSQPNNAGTETPFSMDFPMGDDTVCRGTGRMSTSTDQSQEQAGTPRFMAPEQLQQSAPASPKTDVWSFGVVAHRVLGHSWPIDDEGFSDLLTGVGSPNIASVLGVAPELDPKIAAVIDSCLDLDPQKRPTAQDVADAFSSLAGD